MPRTNIIQAALTFITKTKTVRIIDQRSREIDKNKGILRDQRAEKIIRIIATTGKGVIKSFQSQAEEPAEMSNIK